MNRLGEKVRVGAATAYLLVLNVLGVIYTDTIVETVNRIDPVGGIFIAFLAWAMLLWPAALILPKERG